MGLQQILMVVLGVIIVGVAISLGVVMFSGQAYRSNRTALISEINDFATLAFQYWKLPASMGGAGQNPDNIDPAFLASYLGFSDSYGKVVSIEYKLQSENGTY
ncbi:MAG: hypothetical protein PHI68_08690, partial [Candidatus Cloacimonetes bacterium]|nr:hypothetical protein [Candidatus Cloacimonadota bacterium]